MGQYHTITIATTTCPEKKRIGNFQNGGIFYLDIVSTGDVCQIFTSGIILNETVKTKNEKIISCMLKDIMSTKTMKELCASG